MMWQRQEALAIRNKLVPRWVAREYLTVEGISLGHTGESLGFWIGEAMKVLQSNRVQGQVASLDKAEADEEKTSQEGGS